MQTLRLAAWISRTGLYLVLPSGPHPYGGTPLHPRRFFRTTLARRHRQKPMAEIFTPPYRRKGSLLSWKFVPHIAPALQELVGERVAEMLPALQSIFREGLNPSRSVKEALDRLIDARKRPNHPIAVSHWDRAGHVVGGR